MDPFTPEEVEKLKELRSRVGELLFHEHQRQDAFLITWLRARQLNVDKAEEMLKNNLEWRKKNQVDGILEREPIPEKIRANCPFAYCGEDPATGCPVFLYLMGRHDHRAMLEEMGLEQYQRLTIKFMELVAGIMRDLSAKSGKPVTQFIEICDLEGYSWKQMANKQAREAMMSMQTMMDLNYPECIRHATMINAPNIFYMLFNMMKPLIPKQTLDKLDIQGPDPKKWKPLIAAKYPLDLIPPKWGGNLEGTDEYCSQSSIWLFGPLNTRMFTTPEEEGFEKAKIEAGKKLMLPFEVSSSSKKRFLTWKFWVENYDIGFGILLEGEQVGPFKKIGAESTNDIQVGSHECKTPGKYTLVFDNTYSVARSKVIYHQIVLAAEAPAAE
jgi:hypothetical protein